jgi:hypothetical protein
VAPSIPSSPSANNAGVLLLAARYDYEIAAGGYGYDADGNLMGYTIISPANDTVINPTGAASTENYLNTYETKGSEHFSRTPARSKFRDAPEFGLNGGMKAVCSECTLLLKMSGKVF